LSVPALLLTVVKCRILFAADWSILSTVSGTNFEALIYNGRLKILITNASERTAHGLWTTATHLLPCDAQWLPKHMLNDVLPSFSRRQPASRYVINVRGESEKVLSVEQSLSKRKKCWERNARGVRNFHVLDHRFIRHVGGRRRVEHISGGLSHLVPGCGLLPFEGMLRRGSFKSTRDTHLETCPGQEPSTAWPFKHRHQSKDTEAPLHPLCIPSPISRVTDE